jgi:colicin import membrane protein
MPSMAARRHKNKNYFLISFIAHVLLLLVFILSVEWSSSLPVLENTHQHDVISAVILGDTAKSKIVPKELEQTPPPPKPIVKEETPPPKKIEAKKPEPQIDKEAIALKAAEKKKLAQQKALAEKKLRDAMAKELLADIKKHKDKQEKIKQSKLKSQFQKTLRAQTEKSLRQQLLNEEIKLKGTESRLASGVVDKYKALILQAISEHWIVPNQANKKLSCELMIRVAPGGLVLDVQVTKSSGDPSLDSSARAAVLKASPLPVPKDTREFEAFRRFVLKVKPENILSANN